MNHRYSFSDTYYKGTEKIDFVYLQASDFHFTSLNLKYGITNKLTATLELGYFESKTKTFNDIKAKAYGLGDAILGLQYGINLGEKIIFQPNVKVTLPIGKFDFMDGPVVFPIDFQPSAGSYRYGAGFSAQYLFDNVFWKASLFGSFNYSMPIESDRVKYYKYGNLYNIGASVSYRVWRLLNLNVVARYQVRDKATSSNDFVMNSTGGRLLFVSPKLSYGFGEMWSVNLGVDLPVYKNMNGRQLTNAYMISGGISKTLDFNKNDSVQIKEQLASSHLKTTVKISGTCKACKMKIEEIANAHRGVITAEWSVATHELVIHHTPKCNLEKLYAKLAKVEHLKESEPVTETTSGLPK
jgi:hypothetical protein